MVEFRKRFPLNRAGCGAACQEVGEYLEEQGLHEREVKRLRLTVETLLRRVSERQGRGEAELTLRRSMGRAGIEITYAGAAYDPTLAGREGPGDTWSAQLLTDLGLVPEWSWTRGVNCLRLRPRRRGAGAWLWRGVALALAALYAFVLPMSWVLKLEKLLLAPVCELFVALIGVFAALAVFFSLIDVVCGAGDTLQLGYGGRRLVHRFLLRTGLWTALGTAALALLLPVRLALLREGDAALRLGEALRRVVPGDPFSPFVGGVLPLAFLAAAIGLALLFLGGRAEQARACADQCACILKTVLEALSRLSPLLIFAAVGRLFVRTPRELLLGLWKPLAFFVLFGLVVILVKLLLLRLTRRLPLMELFKRVLPATWAAFSSASPAASFGAAMDNCENLLGIPHPLVLIGLPVGGVMCATVAPLGAVAATLYYAGACAVVMDLPALLGLALTAVLLCYAAPRVPGAGLVCFPLLLAQLGLAQDGLAIMAILSLFFDAFSAALSTAYLQLELLEQSDVGRREEADEEE